MKENPKDVNPYIAATTVSETTHPLAIAKKYIEPLFPGLVFESAGGSVPFQASGTYLFAADFYFRFRHDSASIVIGRPARYVPEQDYFADKYPVTGEEYAGSLTNDEFVKLFTEIMTSLLAKTAIPR